MQIQLSPLFLIESHVVLMSRLLGVLFTLLLILHLFLGRNCKDDSAVSPLTESCRGFGLSRTKYFK